MKRWLTYVGIAQGVAWASFAAALWTTGWPVWIPSLATLGILSTRKGPHA